jgi:hypothetical protein
MQRKRGCVGVEFGLEVEGRESEDLRWMDGEKWNDGASRWLPMQQQHLKPGSQGGVGRDAREIASSTACIEQMIIQVLLLLLLLTMVVRFDLASV